MRKLLMMGLLAAFAGCGSSTGGSSSSSASSSSTSTSGGSASGSTGSGSGTGGTVGTGSGSGAGSTTTNATGSGGSTSSGGSGWRKLTAPADQSNSDLKSVYCTAADKCVLAAGGFDPGGVYALGPNGAQDTALLSGVYQEDGGGLTGLAHQLGDLGFNGFTMTSQGLVARPDNDTLFCINNGDITSAAAWTAVTSTASSVGSNAMSQINVDANNNWTLIGFDNSVFTATQAPGPSTTWTPIWGPFGPSPIPADFDTQFAADPSLCDEDPTAGQEQIGNHKFYLAPDRSVLIGPSGGLNQRYVSDQSGAAPRPGVCISTDQGQHFHYVAFTGLPFNPGDVSSPGPVGVTCTDKDHCVAFAGYPFQKGTGYFYYSANASQGTGSTWTKATMPTGWDTSEDITLVDVFFAPDGVHGWAVGDNSRNALLVRTTDSGHTWTDVSGQLASFSASDLYGGFALDANHIWVVGRYGFIATTDTAQQ